MKNILILCTGNSCRSQIAHGFLANMTNPDLVRVYSAGVETHGLNPGAVRTMAEIGIDISGHTSNHIEEYQSIDFQYVITVCDHARERCPYFPTGAVLLHHNFTDPAKAKGTEEEIKRFFAETRQEIESYCLAFVEKYLSTKERN